MQDSSKGSVLKKASQLTNVPYKTLYKIIWNGVKTRKKRSNFGKFKNLNPTTAAEIRNIVYDCYKKRQIPTAEIAHRTLLEKGENSSRRTLQRWLRNIGFRFGTIDKKDAIMESRHTGSSSDSVYDEEDFSSSEIDDHQEDKENSKQVRKEGIRNLLKTLWADSNTSDAAARARFTIGVPTD
nr:unnamed protein product [Callosobruchus chinensis]